MVQSSGSTMYEKPRDSEQTLPRYSVDGLESGEPLISGQEDPQRPQLTLPGEDDTADVVRAFLRDILTTGNYTDVKEAEQIAANWRLGKGKELRVESPHLFRSIFGDEAAWILYREVQVQKHLEKEAKTPSLTKKTKLAIAAFICAIIIAALLYLTVTWSQALRPILVMLWVGGIVLMLGTIAVATTDCFGLEGTVSSAESALKSSYDSP